MGTRISYKIAGDSLSGLRRIARTIPLTGKTSYRVKKNIRLLEQMEPEITLMAEEIRGQFGIRDGQPVPQYVENAFVELLLSEFEEPPLVQCSRSEFPQMELLVFEWTALNQWFFMEPEPEESNGEQNSSWKPNRGSTEENGNEGEGKRG